MATVNFLFRSVKKEANITARLLFSFQNTNYQFDAKTKIFVSKDLFKKRNKNTKDASLRSEILYLNNKIEALESYILMKFSESIISEVTKDWFKNAVHEFYNPNENQISNELIKYIEHYKNTKRREVSNSTLKKLNVIKELLIRYEKYLEKTLFIKDVNLDFKTQFTEYCFKDGYSLNTIARNLRYIKTFCVHARTNGIETHYQLDAIKTKNENTHHIYLNFEELKKIQELDLTKNERLDNARDWLLISCHCGQRVSDFMNFKKEMISYQTNRSNKTVPIIDFKQKKTSKNVSLPLFPEIQEILKKRHGEFPRKISEQKYNEYIKEVCRLAKINSLENGAIKKETKKGSKKYRNEKGIFEKWKLITSHVGRRSFSTNYYSTDIPTALLINATGHGSENMFLKYIGKTSKDKAIELSEYI